MTHRNFYTQTLLHRSCYTQTLLQTNTFTDKHFYTQTLLHIDAFTHKHFYTQRLLHTDAFAHRSFYTQTFLHADAFTHRHFYTQTLLHTNSFTHKHFYTQTLLHTNTFTHRDFAHRRFYTEKLLHTETFTHRRPDNLEIAILPQFLAIAPHFVRKGCAGPLANRSFTSVFGARTSFRAKGLRGKSQFYISFWRSNLISCKRVARDNLQLAILHQFLAIEPHFVRKGCAGPLANRNFTSVFGDRTSFRAKGLRGTTCNSQFYISFWRSNLISGERVARDNLQLAILHQFLAIEPHFVRKGCVGQLATRNLFVPSLQKRNRKEGEVFGDRTSFRAKGLRGTTWNRNFTLVFGDRTSFRAKGLRGTTCNSQFYISFWRSNLISCERVAWDHLKSQFYFSFWRSNLISCERVARDHLFVPSRWHCPCPAPSKEK